MTLFPAPESVLPPDWPRRAPGSAPAGIPLVVWRWSARDVRPGAGILSPDENARAAALAPARRDRFVAHRTAMRRILAGHLDCAPPEIAFLYSRLGRPSLHRPDTGIDFNLSHSGDLAVLAVSRDGPVGIDIEYARPRSDIVAIARRVLPASWVARLLACPAEARQGTFLELWTRFEACQKARDQGVFSAFHESDHRALAFLADEGCIGHLCMPSSAGGFPETLFLHVADHD